MQIFNDHQLHLPLSVPNESYGLVSNLTPYYTTMYGSAYYYDSLAVLKAIPDNSINLVITSPPYALHFKKEYGNVPKEKYVEWFLPFASEIFRILTPDGSFVLNIGGSYNEGVPTRSLYHFRLLIALIDQIHFHLAQECFWYNPAKMPVPAEWVTVRRIRIRDSVEYIWWFSKTEWPKANNRSVLKEYSKDMQRLNEKGLNAKKRPSGHNIKVSFSNIEAGGSIPPNVIENEISDIGLSDCMLKFGNNSANDTYTIKCKEAGIKPHPARFPSSLPDFFIRLLSEKGDLILDPFAGSNTTGCVAEKLERRWIAVENVESYLIASKFRFD
ncbi:MAG: site-specific DNA-methyltransferase [Anaerolineaceae bacterium]|nr:site-specific DNA-methyltransferase [Anaerolineaceae bacterium]